MLLPPSVILALTPRVVLGVYLSASGGIALILYLVMGCAPVCPSVVFPQESTLMAFCIPSSEAMKMFGSARDPPAAK